MRKLTLAIAALFAFIMEAGACTKFIAAKGATVDGPVVSVSTIAYCSPNNKCVSLHLKYKDERYV